MNETKEVREVRLDGQGVISQLVALRSMADAMSATATSLLIALGAEPAEPTVASRPEDVLAQHPVFGR